MRCQWLISTFGRGQAKTVLVVGAEIHSKGLDISPRGRDVSILFGDGAGAMVLEAIEAPVARGLSDLLDAHPLRRAWRQEPVGRGPWASDGRAPDHG